MKDDQGRERGSRKTTLDDNQVSACPECDDASVQMVNLRGISRPESDDKRYRCSHCYARFDEFVIRERRHDSPPRGLAGKLLDADPDEVSK